MPHHSETTHYPYPPQQLYDLVADVEKYPEFLPWCRAARILERHEGYFTAELIISFKHITERYTSKVIGTPPEYRNAGRIDVELIKGPFKHLSNHWEFTPEGDSGTQLDFSVDFAFKNIILDKLIGSLFTRATEKMVGAFSKRAQELYGNAT